MNSTTTIVQYVTINGTFHFVIPIAYCKEETPLSCKLLLEKPAENSFDCYRKEQGREY